MRERAGAGAGAPAIALVTAAGVDVDALDDRLLVAALAAHGAAVRTTRWDDPDLDWLAFDAVCLRSCWDYHLRYREFSEWLQRVDRAGARVINPVPVVSWNAHKGYLLELRDAGLAVPAMHLVQPGSPFDVGAFLAATDWPDVVIKPAVSASAYRTWRSSAVPVEESAARVAAMLADGDVILQRFVPEIATHGEWSLVLIDGALSHAVRKLPAPGEFRSQRDHGATTTLEDPPAEVLSVAHAAISHVTRHYGSPCLARLDIVETDRVPLIMEVELIEPVLFFGDAPGSADRAAAALIQRARAYASA